MSKANPMAANVTISHWVPVIPLRLSLDACMAHSALKMLQIRPAASSLWTLAKQPARPVGPDHS
jgi:hypothetical protein